MADENKAQFGVEIPPVKGGAEAVKVFDDLAKAAKKAADTLGGVGGSGGAIPKTTDEFGKMRGAAAQLLAQMGPLGAQAALIQQRFGGMAQALGAFRGMAAGLVLGIGAAVTVLIGFAAAIKGAQAAWNLLSEAVARSAVEQRINNTFKNFVGNAKLAQDQLEKLAVAANNRGRGLFDDEEYVQAATLFKSLGADTQNLAGYVESLGKATAFAHSTVEAMGQAYQAVLMGRIRNPTIEQKTLILALADAQKKFGESSEQAYARMIPLIRAQKIGAGELAAALVTAGQEGGRFAHSIEENLTEWQGALRSVHNRWDNFLQALGAPIRDALTPLLIQWSDMIFKLTPVAANLGNAIAAGLTVAKVAASELLGPLEKLYNLVDRLSKLPGVDHVPFLGPAMKSFRFGQSVGGALSSPGGGMNISPKEDMLPNPIDATKDNWTKFREETSKTADEFESDAKLMRDFWSDYVQIQATATSSTERHRREMDLLGKTIEGLADPVSHLNELMSGLTPDEKLMTAWRVYYADRARQEKEMEERMKYGMASTTDSIVAGIRKLQDQWGTWQTQVSQAVVDIGNSLASNISSGLSDILDGTKSISQGFKDMALSIVKSIEQIIIKMLVQIALMQLLNAISGGTGAIGGVSVAALAGLGRAEGGIIPGEGNRDSVPAMLTPGEYVINKRSAQKIGYGRLERLNRMAAGGVVRSGRRSYGDFADWEVPLPGGGWSEPPDLFDWGYPRPTVTWGGGGDMPSTEAWGGSDNPIANRFMAGFAGFGTSPWSGASLFGPTMVPTLWTNYPGVGAVPMAVPVGGWTADPGTLNIGTSRHSIRPVAKAGGGLIGSVGAWASYAGGGAVSRRMVGGGGTMVVNNVSASSATQVHVEVNNFGGGNSATRTRGGGGGLTEADAREIGRVVNAVIDQRINRGKHVGGDLYVSRAQRGG